MSTMFWISSSELGAKVKFVERCEGICVAPTLSRTFAVEQSDIRASWDAPKLGARNNLGGVIPVIARLLEIRPEAAPNVESEGRATAENKLTYSTRKTAQPFHGGSVR